MLRWVTLLPTVTLCRGWPRHSAAIPTPSCTPSTLLATSWRTEVLKSWAGMSLQPQKLMFNSRSHQQLPPVLEAAARGGMSTKLCLHSHSGLSALIRGHCLQPACGEESQGSAEPQLGQDNAHSQRYSPGALAPLHKRSDWRGCRDTLEKASLWMRCPAAPAGGKFPCSAPRLSPGQGACSHPSFPLSLSRDEHVMQGPHR